MPIKQNFWSGKKIMHHVKKTPLLSGNLKPQSKVNASRVMSNPNKSHKPGKQETSSALSHYKPARLKPLDNLPILNKRNFSRSNLDLKFYLNSLCFSLNLSDTLNNCYRDINFDSCTLCVCNNNYLKGLDYSIYICNDVLNSNTDYYDYSDMIEGAETTSNQNAANSSQLASRSDQTGNVMFFGILRLKRISLVDAYMVNNKKDFS